MVDDKNLPNHEKPAWATGIQLFTEISGWIVGPIILALIAGKALDGHFGTKPWIFIAFATLGFLMTIFGIIKVVKNYMKKINDGK